MMSYVTEYALGMVRESVEGTVQGLAKSVSDTVDKAKAQLPELPDDKPLRLAQARETREATKLKYARLRELDAAKNKPDNVLQQKAFLHYARRLTWMEIRLAAEMGYQQSCYWNQAGIDAVKKQLETIQKLLHAKNWHSLCFLAKEGDVNDALIQEILHKNPALAVAPKKEKSTLDAAHVKEWNELLNEYKRLIQFIYEQKCRYRLFAKAVTEEQITRMDQLEKMLSADTMDELVKLRMSFKIPRP